MVVKKQSLLKALTKAGTGSRRKISGLPFLRASSRASTQKPGLKRARKAPQYTKR